MKITIPGSSIWLSRWTNEETKRVLQFQESGDKTNATLLEFESSLENSRLFNLYVFAGLFSTLLVASMIRSAFFFKMCMISSRRLHDRMFIKVLRVASR